MQEVGGGCNLEFRNEFLLIVFLLLILLITLIVLLITNSSTKRRLYDLYVHQKQKDSQVSEQLTQLASLNQRELYEFRLSFEKGLKDDFERLSYGIDRRILHLQNQVDNKLEQNLEQTTKTFQDVLVRLNRIDYAQKKLDDLSVNINALENILSDKTARGAFGEIQLEHIFQTVFGENPKLYQRQYTLSNQTKVDLMLFAPGDVGNIAIDSKFPLENYRRVIETTGQEQVLADRAFKQDVKKHIDDIARKYIIPDETADYAILFLPAEAVFSHLQAYHQDIVNYGYQKNIWLASPTTLMALLTTLQATLRNMERDKYASIIRDELQLLGTEFKRYQSRWQTL